MSHRRLFAARKFQYNASKINHIENYRAHPEIIRHGENAPRPNYKSDADPSLSRGFCLPGRQHAFEVAEKLPKAVSPGRRY